eukprot:TRINITY_DN30570_c0_g1_i1.p1 TRINITY_DN30570_c0_g1~~TRINITY_DN30570_c0_g1_i1.p1  ORF type:complete len:140 (+),score=23.13 TRINITY_DN30570_c0_g1_i1:90-509(+)
MATLSTACAGLSLARVQTASSCLEGSRHSLKNVSRGESRWVCKKEGIHPTFYPEAKVYCNGELVMTTGGTKAEYVVDVWSGNHPFYQGNSKTLITEAGRVDRFQKRFGNVGVMSEIPILTKGEIIIEKKKGPVKKGGRR